MLTQMICLGSQEICSYRKISIRNRNCLEVVEIVDVDVIEIKAYIERSGFKQKAVAEKSGLDEYKLCMSLQGKRKLEAGEYANICSALGVPMTMFVKPRTWA